ncbi:amidohydrolase family protein (plasmid) [Lichenicola cladoniae]|uniref:Amidohydrolase family protein n=1 Tax=Lichenicola cladoniae TaxID=1484109 RepID=A0A6M8HXJ1_9PROT|nr:amidohydrolase family protein [Lichenicola cladoniae]NPD68678.1 amidohydrolase family protein [Acetobacteraceae bacterium]QKE93060.1 amidohydrolase family protein [Lichenicola cladoniae]
MREVGVQVEQISVELDEPVPVDTHVHVFLRDHDFSADRRYAPNYDAPPEALLGAMADGGIGAAILIQPSFLGSDNRYILDVISARPKMFRGVAVVDPAIAPAELDRLRDGGIVGVRLNCIGRPAPNIGGAALAPLAERLAERGLVLEIQAEGRQWIEAAPALARAPCAVVVDHFGRCDPDDASFAALLDAAASHSATWFKFSAPYRLAPLAAEASAEAILNRVGPGRVVWGSDWPWTQHEGAHRYADTLDWLARWVPDPALRRAILVDNPRQLFGSIGPQLTRVAA